jgi:hypothetical protein
MHQPGPTFNRLRMGLLPVRYSFVLNPLSVDGDHAYILWTAETADDVYEIGTDTFVVRDGKIVAQSFAAKITPKG